jgi:hypothetical protein
VIVEHDQQLNAPHVTMDVVQIEVKLMNLVLRFKLLLEFFAFQ